ncbi:MAG: NifB/NifX family molybdenum-iron cluster-binding protein [Syntrophales bacterium]
MKIAVTVWEDSVSTVCDFCGRVLIFDVEANEANNPLSLAFETEVWPARVNLLRELGVGVLLCGAVSRPLERLLATAGIEVIAWLCGSVDEIIRAYLEGGLSDTRFALPGFGPGGGHPGGRNRRQRRGCRLPRSRMYRARLSRTVERKERQI